MTDIILNTIFVILAFGGILFSYLAIKGCGLVFNHKIFLKIIYKKWDELLIRPSQKASTYERAILFVSGMLMSFISILYLIFSILD